MSLCRIIICHYVIVFMIRRSVAAQVGMENPLADWLPTRNWGLVLRERGSATKTGLHSTVFFPQRMHLRSGSLMV